METWIAESIAKCRATVAAAAPGFPYAAQNCPVKLLTRRSRCAGTFHGMTAGKLGPNLGYININVKICNTPERFESTLLHEFAHALVHWENQRDVGGHHGLLWRAWMRKLGQDPKATTHDYDLNEAFGAYYKYADCKNGHLARLKPSIVAKLRAGEGKAVCCGRCYEPIVGELRDRPTKEG